jgi:hypothetical protein
VYALKRREEMDSEMKFRFALQLILSALVIVFSIYMLAVIPNKHYTVFEFIELAPAIISLVFIYINTIKGLLIPEIRRDIKLIIFWTIPSIVIIVLAWAIFISLMSDINPLAFSQGHVYGLTASYEAISILAGITEPTPVSTGAKILMDIIITTKWIVDLFLIGMLATVIAERMNRP